MSPYKKLLIASLYLLVCITVASCSNSSEPNTSQPEEAYSGGTTTIFDATASAFKTPAPNLSAASLDLHTVGDEQFEATFVTAPAPLNGGLGPVYNNTSCAGCHVNDGRGTPPNPGDQFSSMLFRLSIAGTGPNGEPNPAPGFGGQLQDRAVYNVSPEGLVVITYHDSTSAFADGEQYTLRVPVYTVINAYTNLPSQLLLSPRVAPPVFGLGLLEAVSESTILQHADEADGDGDGISGRANFVWDVILNKAAIGRFGHKANQPNLLQQSAAAYNGDMGITSRLFPLESCHNQPQNQGNNSTSPEVNDETVNAVTHYVRTLAVPARRNVNDPTVLRGKQVFIAAKCSGCHLQTLTTNTLPDIPEVSNQTIHPFTDLLIHDMGPALADNRPDFLASGSEWRTAPLWGIGLTLLVNGHSNFLHDGRARNVMEAILWHGGEAEKSREFVRTSPKADREALVAFLQSL